MKILNVYFHNDFDGVVASVLLTKILEKKYEEFDFFPVDYDIKDDWLNKSLKGSCAILDFLYHPDSLYFFDHHTTSFLTEELKNNFKNSDRKYWNPDFKSTPSLLKKAYANQFNFTKYEDLIYWSDVIDSAGYESPFQIYDNNNKYMILNKLISHYRGKKKFLKRLISSFKEERIDNLLEEEQETIGEIIKNEYQLMNVLKGEMYIRNHICFFDQSDLNIDFQRYASYFYYPDIDYTVAISKKNKGFSISLGYNPWKNENFIDLGILAKDYGGGGRKNVAGIIVDTHSEAIEKTEQIVEYINSFIK